MSEQDREQQDGTEQPAGETAPLVEDVQEPPQEPVSEPGEQNDEQGDPLAAARREAASYRRRLRDAEGDRDRLADQVAGYQRREVEQLVERGRGFRRMSSGSDLWTGGVSLTDVLAEDGRVDQDKALAAMDRVLQERPHWAAPVGDVGFGPRPDSGSSGPSFADVLRRATTG